MSFTNRFVRITVVLLIAVLCFMVVFVWKIGPVVLTLADSHGVHSGDLVVFPLGLLALYLLVSLVRDRK